MIRQFSITFGVLICFAVTIINSKRYYTIQIDEANLLNSTYLEGFYNFSRLTVTKFNRSLFVLNVDIEILEDWTEDYFFDITFYSKKRAGLSWSKGPYQWPKTRACDGLRLFKRFIPNDYNNTNIPLPEENSTQCLLPKVNSYFTNPK